MIRDVMPKNVYSRFSTQCRSLCGVILSDIGARELPLLVTQAAEFLELNPSVNRIRHRRGTVTTTALPPTVKSRELKCLYDNVS